MEEHNALNDILRHSTTPLFLFDELNRCVSWADATLPTSQTSEELLQWLNLQPALYHGKFNDKLRAALDDFDFSIDNSRINEFPDAQQISIIKMEAQFGEFHHIRNLTVGWAEAESFDIENVREDASFEQSVWHCVQDLFRNNIYLRPEVETLKKKRELTDVFAHSEFGIFFI